MPVEPITIYEAYCDLNFPDHTHDDGLEPVEGCPGCEEICEWSWVCDRYGDSGDCEIELCLHMRAAHNMQRELPDGYEYRQKDLDDRLGKHGGMAELGSGRYLQSIAPEFESPFPL